VKPILKLSVAAVAVLVAGGVGSARADVVMPPPTNCPDGARGRTSHSGPHCAPWTCERGCEEGKVCRPVGLCIAKRQGANRRGGRFEFEVVTGTCKAGEACANGTCEVREVCASSAEPVEPPAAVPDAGPGETPAAATAVPVLPSAPDAAIEPAAPAVAPESSGPVAPGTDAGAGAEAAPQARPGTEARKPESCSAVGGGGMSGWGLTAAAMWGVVQRLRRRRLDA